MGAPKFLIVEDSPVVRLAIRQALKNSSVDDRLIFDADTASKAIEVFNQERPDVAFVDISLPIGKASRPGAEGFFGFLAVAPSALDGGSAAARYMMAHHPALKLIVCTGNPPEDPRVRELIKAGAFQVLEKPLRAEQIRGILERLRTEA
ncbi:MAG: response regulator [Thermoplasmata archaeon]|nr:response regulator [Thermoplasmata archaeon]